MVSQIIPALLEGKVVITDRWHDTTWAYQGHGMGLGQDLIGFMMRRFDNTIYTTVSDPVKQRFIEKQIKNYATVFLRASIATSRERVGRRSTDKDAFELDGDDFFHKVELGFSYRLAGRSRDGNMVIPINANKFKEEVEADVRDVFLHLIP